MATPKYHMLEDQIAETSLDLTGPLVSIIGHLKRLRDIYHNRGWHDLRVEQECVDYEVYSNNLVGNRWETDEEYAKRVKRRKAYLKRKREERRG